MIKKCPHWELAIWLSDQFLMIWASLFSKSFIINKMSSSSSCLCALFGWCWITVTATTLLGWVKRKMSYAPLLSQNAIYFSITFWFVQRASPCTHFCHFYSALLNFTQYALRLENQAFLLNISNTRVTHTEHEVLKVKMEMSIYIVFLSYSPSQYYFRP